MSKDIDIQFISEAYSKMSDEDLVRVLTQDVAGLTSEALNIVHEEVRKRNLNPNILRGIEAQQKTFSEEEIDKYCRLIQCLPCPKSGQTDKLLNATVAAEVKSFLIFTQYKKKLVIGSPEILDKANNKALINSLLLGWWGFPWGIIRTIQAIVINIKNKKTNHLEEPNDYLRSFVLSRIGQIETYRDDPNKLEELLSNQ